MCPIHAAAIDELVPLPQDGIKADEVVLDYAKRVGAFATDCVHPVENLCADREARLLRDTLYRFQCRLRAVEHHAAQGAFDLAEYAVLDRT